MPQQNLRRLLTESRDDAARLLPKASEYDRKQLERHIAAMDAQIAVVDAMSPAGEYDTSYGARDSRDSGGSRHTGAGRVVV